MRELAAKPPLLSPVLMQGNEAVVEGALAAGMRFYAGYPITPSTEIAELCAERLPRVGGKFIQMEDEIASMAAVIGASMAGKKAMTATSGPGFSLKQENIGFAAETEVPCVVVDVQRMGPSSGIATAPAQGDVLQSRSGSHGDYAVIVLSPASVQEAYLLAVRAFNLAEALRVPVILLLDELIGHLREAVSLPDPASLEIVNRSRPERPPGQHQAYAAEPGGVPAIPLLGEGYRFHATGLLHAADGFPTTQPTQVEALIRRLTEKVTSRMSLVYQAETALLDDAEVVVLAYGGTARSAQRAVRLARQGGIRAGLYRPVTIWPFDHQAVHRACTGRRAVIVPELNLGQLVGEVERAVKGSTPVVPLNKVNGEILTPGEILRAIEGVR